ncbi:MAG: hypothetical protein LBF44_00055 [Holosporaceae bacterium]|jgi:uncharacterized protein (DUF927 family)|nr:hypothetical protein [Holosporaceae bacterium]
MNFSGCETILESFVIEYEEVFVATYDSEDLKLIKSERIPEHAGGQDMRAFEKFIFVGFAGELATRYGITGWNIGDSREAALKCFHSWLEDKGGVGDREDKKIMEQVKAFFELHVCSRFYDLDGSKDQKINNMAGYKREFEDEIVYYVTISVFQKEICRGFSRNHVIDVLKKNKIFESEKNCTQQKWTPHGNKRVYIFNGKLLL